jgi:hypothetical protein
VTTDALSARVRALLDRARHEESDPAARETLDAAVRRLDEPMRVAIAGRVKAGKSTLLNALVGEELAPTDAGECTRIVTWYRDGPTYRVVVHPLDGEPAARPFERTDGAIQVRLGIPAARVDHLTVELPSRRLREHTLIDTPGLDSLSSEVSARTLAFLETDGDGPARADAVIYLLGHSQANDVGHLSSFRAVNAVGVLSRADEVGGAQLDAMQQAARVAAGYAADERLRQICPVVVPVAGLLAAASATLREDEYRCLATVAGAPPDIAAGLLLTADRFVAANAALPGTEELRRRTLDRLGLFGVRLGLRLVADGTVHSADELARELAARSGVNRLSGLLQSQFVQRSRVLKAHSALAALDGVLRARPNAGLAARAEAIRAGAHEFVEVRTLHLLRSGRLTGTPAQVTEMDRLLGGSGAAFAARLGQPSGTPPAALASAAADALARWQRIAEHPISGGDLRRAARVTARTCEGILAALGQPGDTAQVRT